MGMKIGGRTKCVDGRDDSRPHVVPGVDGAQGPQDGVIGGAREQPEQPSVRFEKPPQRPGDGERPVPVWHVREILDDLLREERGALGLAARAEVSRVA
jgi:hypothetical protein